jgi:hypothetical protein
MILVPAVFYVAVLVLSVWRPRAATIVIGVFFAIMAIGVNMIFSIMAPSAFVSLGTDAPLLPVYAWFFTNVVSRSPIVLGLFAAAFELAVAVLMLLGGRRADWGLGIGAAYLCVIAPLGPWSVTNLILAGTMLYILRRQRRYPVLPPELPRLAG